MAKYPDVTAGQTEAFINRIGGWDNFLRFIGGQGKVVFDTILAFVRTVRIAAQPAITTSEEYFKEAGIYSMGGNFKNFKAQFLGLEVQATDEAELAVHRLEQDSLDKPIMAELGDRAEISVSQFCAFLAANRESTEWFIFYLKGENGKSWAVGAGWYSGGGWSVDADSVTDPDGWGRGSQVVSQVAA